MKKLFYLVLVVLLFACSSKDNGNGANECYMSIANGGNVVFDENIECSAYEYNSYSLSNKNAEIISSYFAEWTIDFEFNSDVDVAVGSYTTEDMSYFRIWNVSGGQINRYIINESLPFTLEITKYDDEIGGVIQGTYDGQLIYGNIYNFNGVFSVAIEE